MSTSPGKSEPKAGSGALRWLDERYQLQDLLAFLGRKSVPRSKHHVWYYFGGVSLFLFLVQVISGILLLLYYQPGESTAHESVKYLISEVEFGWLMRSIHSWSANLMVGAIFIHMFSVFFTRAYRRPRELTWISGAMLLLLALGFGFSGYLLPWDELAFFATKVGTDIVGVVPVVGDFLLRLLRGSEDVTGATLTRFFGLHIAVLPGLFTLILGLHLIQIQRQGMSEPDEWRTAAPRVARRMPFFPNFLLRDLLLWLIVLNVLAVLAVLFPWELGPKADPFAPAPAGIRPEWYFMFMFETLKLLPAHIWFLEGELVGVLGFSLVGLLWILVPFIDRRAVRGEPNRILARIGVVAVTYVVVMTVKGYLS
jgi:cytochrome b6